MFQSLYVCFVLLACNLPTQAFVSDIHSLVTRKSSLPTSETYLSALTERQMQFWEDVDEGLDDIANFYAKKGEGIDRIRVFSKT
jgi:hypothetical protein